MDFRVYKPHLDNVTRKALWEMDVSGDAVLENGPVTVTPGLHCSPLKPAGLMLWLIGSRSGHYAQLQQGRNVPLGSQGGEGAEAQPSMQQVFPVLASTHLTPALCSARMAQRISQCS